QIANPHLAVQRPPHVRADELRPTPRVALSRQNLSGLGSETSLEHYPPRKQLSSPPQQVLVPLIAVLRALGDDGDDRIGQRSPGGAMAPDQELGRRRLARTPQSAESDPHHHPSVRIEPPTEFPTAAARRAAAPTRPRAARRLGIAGHSQPGHR